MLTPQPPSRHSPPQLPAPDARPLPTTLSFAGLNHHHHHHSTPDDAERGQSTRVPRSTPTAADSAGGQHLGSGAHVSTRQQHPRFARRDQGADVDGRGQGDGTDGGLAGKVSCPIAAAEPGPCLAARRLFP